MTVSVTATSTTVKPPSRLEGVLTGIAKPHEDGLLGLAQPGEGARRRSDRHGDLLYVVSPRGHDARREVGVVLLDRVGPLKRVAIPARARRSARSGRRARGRVVPF